MSDNKRIISNEYSWQKKSFVTNLCFLFRIYATSLISIIFTAIFLGKAVNADIIADRKAGFKENAASMKVIAAAFGSRDYDSIINEVKNISSWAQKIPNHFPKGSDTGETKARAEIWFDFDDFETRAKSNQTAAEELIAAVVSRDQSAMITSLKNLGSSCKFCHTNYKN